MALSAADRVRLSRWVNKVEELGDELLTYLRQAPVPLPREPMFDPELVEKLSLYVAVDDAGEDEQDYPRERFLKLGNGHQSSNRDIALYVTAQLVPSVTIVDRNTIDWKGVGRCHFAAFTHPKGAMISSTRSQNPDFGGATWHSKQKIAMFRDVGDGHCIVYACPIEPLFERRTIGHHGVKWEDVQRIAIQKVALRSVDAKRAIEGRQVG